jgi:hypothetical protein
MLMYVLVTNLSKGNPWFLVQTAEKALPLFMCKYEFSVEKLLNA